MKIDGSNIQADLLAQMQEVAKQPAQGPSGHPFEVSKPESKSATNAVDGAETSLENKVKETARLALDGKIESSDEARSRVLGAIIDDKLQTISSARKRKQVRETLEVGLASDPTLLREVDRMLLLAAKEVARERR